MSTHICNATHIHTLSTKTTALAASSGLFGQKQGSELLFAMKLILNRIREFSFSIHSTFIALFDYRVFSFAKLWCASAKLYDSFKIKSLNANGNERETAHPQKI